MKFGQKIFLMSFTLIIIVINVIGIIMINYTYKTNIEKEIDKGMIQINNIMTEIENGIDRLSDIANMYLENNVNIEIYNSGKKIYTNFKEEHPEIEEKLFSEEDKMSVEELWERYCEVTEKNVNTYETNEENKDVEDGVIKIYIKENQLFMKLRKNARMVVISSDITEVNKMKQEQISYFVNLSLASSFLIALLLSISVSFLTRKIKVLNKTVQEVEKGNYNVKLRKLGNDEIGNVGKSFNKMTTAIEKNIAEIQEVSENRKRFIGNLTHEIRTPLTSIIGYSSLIKNKKITDEAIILDYSNKIYEEGKYIEKISQKLMDLLLLESGNIEIESINLSEELNRRIDELQEIFPNVVYQREITKNVYVRMDKTLLKSLIFNLVKNAINAYEKEAIVKIELSQNKEICIIDYGKGIPNSEIEKIKEPFYTLSKDRNRCFSGMGLGLPLCIRIVELQGGKLQIESKEKVGTKITIKLGDESEI